MTVAQRLSAAVASGAPVTLAHLGQPKEICEAADELASGPFAPFVAGALAAERESDPREASFEPALHAFVRGLQNQRSYLALREATDMLLVNQAVLEDVGVALHDAMLPTRSQIGDAPLLAGLRLQVALEVVARTSIRPFGVLGLLTGPVDGLPQDFDDPLARAIGVAADVWTAPEEQAWFRDSLAVLVDRGSGDAMFERAVHVLRAALVKQDKDSVLDGIRDARDALRAVTEVEERRDDAEAYLRACEAILAFDEYDAELLTSAAIAARVTAQRRALLSHGLHARALSQARALAEVAWTSLAWRLESAARELSHNSFLDTWEAIDAILDVFVLDRQLVNLRMLSTIVEPRITNTLAKRESMLSQLERAVKIDSRRAVPVLAAEVSQLIDLAHRARATPREPSDPAQEDSSPTTSTAQLLGGGASVLLSEFSLDKRASLEASARQVLAGQIRVSHLANRTLDPILERTISALEENPSFVGKTRTDFSLLVLLTLRFLSFVEDTPQAYTAPITTGGNMPLEADMQRHFHQFLCGTDLAGRVGMEYPNIATGRADVVVLFDDAVRFVTEAKREKSNASPSRIESKYVAQAAAYQGSNEPFGQLLVLDLTDHSSGTPHISESMWAVHGRDESGRVNRSTVIAVVRGNRPKPSALR
jgi:hypothetical protein